MGSLGFHSQSCLPLLTECRPIHIQKNVLGKIQPEGQQLTGIQCIECIP